MLPIRLPDLRPSPYWGVKWVGIHMAILLSVVTFVLFGGVGLLGFDVFPAEWTGRREAVEHLGYRPDDVYLLTATGLPHVDPASGLVVGRWTNWGGSERDQRYVRGWNGEMERRRAIAPARWRFDGRTHDGASILREFEARAAEVVVWRAPDERFAKSDVEIGGVRLRIRHTWHCIRGAPIRVGDHVAPYPVGDQVVEVTRGDGTPVRPGFNRSWIPCASEVGALPSADGRTIWLKAEAERGPDGTSGLWTVSIDTATGLTIGADHTVVR